MRLTPRRVVVVLAACAFLLALKLLMDLMPGLRLDIVAFRSHGPRAHRLSSVSSIGSLTTR